MPLAAYFRNVGAALLALLFVANFTLPVPPVVVRTLIRHDDRDRICEASCREWRRSQVRLMPVMGRQAGPMTPACATHSRCCRAWIQLTRNRSIQTRDT